MIQLRLFIIKILTAVAAVAVLAPGWAQGKDGGGNSGNADDSHVIRSGSYSGDKISGIGIRVNAAVRGFELTGMRSRISVQRIIMLNVPAIRYAYNRRLREVPDLSGRITVEFSIDEHGTVISAGLKESTMNDTTLERSVVERVKHYQFEPVPTPGDITRVTYPFDFEP